MTLRWRQVDRADRPGCAELVEQWGYFRPVGQDEVYGCEWYALCREEADGGEEEVALLWYTSAPESDALAAHICSDPLYRGRLDDAASLYTVELIASLMNANRVYSVLVGAKDLRVNVIKRWLSKGRWLFMPGWREHEYGMVREIGGA